MSANHETSDHLAELVQQAHSKRMAYHARYPVFYTPVDDTDRDRFEVYTDGVYQGHHEALSWCAAYHFYMAGELLEYAVSAVDIQRALMHQDTGAFLWGRTMRRRHRDDY